MTGEAQDVGTPRAAGGTLEQTEVRPTVGETTLTIGARAPDFLAPDQTGQSWRLSDALGRAAQVLVFYRGDW